VRFSIGTEACKVSCLCIAIKYTAIKKATKKATKYIWLIKDLKLFIILCKLDSRLCPARRLFSRELLRARPLL